MVAVCTTLAAAPPLVEYTALPTALPTAPIAVHVPTAADHGTPRTDSTPPPPSLPLALEAGDREEEAAAGASSSLSSYLILGVLVYL